MPRFTKVIGAYLTALPAGLLAAYGAARASFQPQPPVPGVGDVSYWLLTFNDPLAFFIAIASGVSGGYAIWQMFQPDPATAADVTTDGRTTRAGVAHVSDQVAAEGRASDVNHAVTHKFLAAELHEKVEIAVANEWLTEVVGQRIYAAVAAKYGDEQAARAVEQIRAVVEEQDDATLTNLIASGDFVGAADHQRTTAEQAVVDAAKAWRDTARLTALTNVEQAIRDYAKSADLDPTDFWTWIELSRLQDAAGSLLNARRAADSALQHARDDRDTMVANHQLGDIAVGAGEYAAGQNFYLAATQVANDAVACNPDDSDWQLCLSICYAKLGGIAVSQECLSVAARAYNDGHIIISQLAKSDPTNILWQRHLFASHNSIALVALAMGHSSVATRAYQEAHSIALTMAERNSGDEARHLVMASHYQLGSLAMAQNSISDASVAYHAGFVVAQQLAERDPSNAHWQRDLSFGYNRLGDVAMEQEEWDAAGMSYRAGFAIAELLAKRDPEAVEYKQDLSLSYGALGRLAMAEQDWPAASKAYRASHAIDQELAALNSENTEWQRKLAESHGQLGDLQHALGDERSAGIAHRASRDIYRRLVDRDQSDAISRSELSRTYDRLGHLAENGGDWDTAGKLYRARHAIAEQLVKHDPSNAMWQYDLAYSHIILAQFTEAQRDLTGAIIEFGASEAIMLALIERIGENPDYVRHLQQCRADLARLRALA